MKAALVVGGSSGIGRAIAEMLSGEGYALTLAARNTERLDAVAASLAAYAVPTDVARPEDCRHVVDAHAERHGRLDVLVNAAGFPVARPADEVDVSEWDAQLAVNLRGLFLVTQAAIPLLRASRGLVVNIASLSATMPSPLLAAYGAAKAAVIHLTKTLNAELDRYGVRATAISPAMVNTAMRRRSDVPPERVVQPGDCAEIVRLLLRLSPYARIPHVPVERVDHRS